MGKKAAKLEQKKAGGKEAPPAVPDAVNNDPVGFLVAPLVRNK